MRRITQQQGFSLIEVLVALVISSIIMLGVASAQIKGINASTSARFKSVATEFTDSLGDAVKAHPGFWGAVEQGFQVSINPSGDVGAMIPYFSSKMKGGLSGAKLETSGSCGIATGSCSQAYMVTYDLKRNATNLFRYIPSASVDIKNIAGVGESPFFEITVTWKTKQKGIGASSAGGKDEKTVAHTARIQL